MKPNKELSDDRTFQKQTESIAIFDDSSGMVSNITDAIYSVHIPEICRLRD